MLLRALRSNRRARADVRNESVTSSWEIQSDGWPIPPGEVTILMTMVATASLGDPIPDAGQARIEVRGSITGLSVT